MKFFLAGIMQGSHTEAVVHDQQYRRRLKALLAEHFPGAEVFDPFDGHEGSIAYDEATGRSVFFHHNAICRQVDVLLAFVPEASMGTAIEMWEAYKHGAAVVAVSPLKHNWTVKFLSHRIYADVAELEAALEAGEVERLVAGVLPPRNRSRSGT
jgi:hypothetical protein